MTGCFLKLLSQLPNIMKRGTQRWEVGGYEKFSQWHQNVWACNLMQPNLLSIRKKFLLSSVNSQCKDQAKFAEDTDSHFIGEELEDSLKKSRGRYCSLQALNPKTNYPHPSAKQKLYGIPKNDRPTKRSMACHKGTPEYNSPKYIGRTKKQFSRISQCKNHHKHGRN